MISVDYQDFQQDVLETFMYLQKVDEMGKHSDAEYYATKLQQIQNDLKRVKENLRVETHLRNYHVWRPGDDL